MHTSHRPSHDTLSPLFIAGNWGQHDENEDEDEEYYDEDEEDEESFGNAAHDNGQWGTGNHSAGRTAQASPMPGAWSAAPPGIAAAAPSALAHALHALGVGGGGAQAAKGMSRKTPAASTTPTGKHVAFGAVPSFQPLAS